MSDAGRQLLDALRWRLQALSLAGVKRVPRLWPQAKPAASAPPVEASGAAGSQSWADVARELSENLDAKSAEWARRNAAAASPPPASAPRQADGRGRPAPAAPHAAPSPAPAGRQAAQQEDRDLRPSRPLDPAAAAELDALARTVSQCTRCKELVANRTQTVFSDGPGNADLMFIGEAPGEDEDRQGVAFVGRAGQLLTKIIAGGMRMRRQDAYICNILKCRPPGNRNPLPQEAVNCREYLDRQIELVGPKVICLLGGVASRFLLDDPTPVGRMRGRWFQYRGIPVRVTYHPAYLLRSYNQDTRQKVWDDVLQVVGKLKELRHRPGGPRESAGSLF